MRHHGLDNATAPFDGLPDIHDLTALSVADRSCLNEVRGVLERHGLQSRFGVSLLHKHFDVASDEVLIEECDERARVLTIRPMKKSGVNADRIIETNWRLDTAAALLGCSQFCIGSGSSHTTHHSG